jgi:NTE family protein
MAKTLKGFDAVTAFRNSSKGQIVLVLQGGGALGAYQVGVYQALHEAGIKLDWVIGTSIGAINAGLIAGNTPERRVDALQEFWRRMRSEGIWHYLPAWTGLPDVTSYLTTLFGGISSFFRPNAAAFLGPHLRLGAERAGFYSTAPLRKTVSELVDFSLINRSSLRVTVGASEVRTGVMRYFDSRDQAITIDHILASSALPPAFPAVRIDGNSTGTAVSYRIHRPK